MHSRGIVAMMQEDGEQMGRFKVRGLMRELELVSKLLGSHAYKQATVGHPAACRHAVGLMPLSLG